MVKQSAVVAVCIVIALAAGEPPTFRAAEAAQAPSASQGDATPQPPGMEDMKKMHEQMMAEMKAADEKLDALVKEMNAASRDAKVEAVAAVVNELVRQHKTMHSRMGQMHDQMMGMGGMMKR